MRATDLLLTSVRFPDPRRRDDYAAPAIGPYTLQAAIAAVHSSAPSFAATDWNQIIGLYDLLLQAVPFVVAGLALLAVARFVPGRIAPERLRPVIPD